MLYTTSPSKIGLSEDIVCIIGLFQNTKYFLNVNLTKLFLKPKLPKRLSPS